jgi:phosphotransferase system  glucose/maltose/N-acetylglucosamine-specific IIC component
MRDKIKAMAWIVISCIALPVYSYTAWFNTFNLPEQYQIVYLIPIGFHFFILYGFAVAYFSFRDKKPETSTQQTKEVR